MNHSVSPDPRFRAWLTERAARVAPPDLLHRTMAETTTLPQESRWALRRQLHRFSVPAAAIVLLVVAAGAGILLSRVPAGVVAPTAPPSALSTSAATRAPTPGVSVAPVRTVTPTPAIGSSPTASATPSSALPFQEWARADMPDPAPDTFGGGTPTGVIRLGDGYLAVGQAVTGGFDNDRVVFWTSSDGTSWQMEDRPGLPAVGVTQVLTDGERMVIIGSSTTDTAACCETAAWVSTDGVGWERATGLVPSLAAVGSDAFIGARVEGERSRFTASTDGGAWTRASELFVGKVTGLAVDAGGRAIAIGHRSVSSGDGSATTDLLIWRSSDGSSWSDQPIVLHDARPDAVAAGPAGFIVAGQEYAYRQDGSVESIPRVWRLVGTGLDPSAIELAEGQSVDRMAALGETLVATGTESLEGVANILAWISADGGASWTRVPPQEAFAGIGNRVRGVTVSPDGGLVAVGQRWDFEAGHMVPVAWSSTR